MNVVFRADASLEIGTGHVMRCLTLANALRETGASCTFVCRAHEGHLGEHIRACGHALHLLPRAADFCPADEGEPYACWLGSTPEQDAEQTLAVLISGCDWLVVDHYGLNARWETRLRARARHLLVIDDLANRQHDCELLLDQNLGREARDYDGLVGDRTQRLIGPRYALLRPEFAQWRETSLARRRQPSLRQLLITMGGVDKDNATGLVLDALGRSALPSDCRVVVVMGPHAPWLNEVRQKAKNFPFSCTIMTNVSNMAELMASSDLAIGAAGSTSWERCCLGVPTITVVLAENQRGIGVALSAAGAAVLLASHDLTRRLPDILRAESSVERLSRLGEQAAALVDGQGCQRVIAVMEPVA